MIENYDATKLEPEILEFWKKHNIYEKAKDKNKGKAKFYFLDGPPYTSGKVHLGTAWNKSLKDSVLRYKRMKGFDVWDRAGYDMHGLPTEQAVEKKLGLSHKDEIPNYGIANFVNECREFAITNMISMNNDFKRIGVWMDFENAYRSIENTFMEGEWWLIKKAFENNRLYEGEKTMHWCQYDSTSMAKHELIYEDLTETSIYVKLKIDGTEDEYFIIWTTTPWTIPFNLGVVVHPDFEYVKCKVGYEHWIVAKELAEEVIKNKLGKEYEVVDTFLGTSLEGKRYIPAFDKVFPELEEEKNKTKPIHTILLSKDFVHLEEGTALVHFAPGCGDTSYELAIKYHIKPFSLIDERGSYPKGHPVFKGLIAKKDDIKFIELMEKNGSLVGKAKFTHSYPHCWRCKHPVIFKPTTQWFFKTEDLKDKMRILNKNIKWVPDFAGSKNFDNWIANLRDNGITRQRYWGTPLPIWKCRQCNDFIVIGSIDELKKLAGRIPDDLHKPWIDEVKISCQCGSMKERIPDVLDVWIDSGSASWNCLDYPRKKDLFEKLYPADFILEGIDQIRGWFNLLFVASMIAMNNISFKAAYMHGFINDAQGRKMSKSLGNYILPQEVIIEYGADTLRYYMIGGTAPGVDINYNFDDMKVKHKNLAVLWNLHKFLIEMSNNIKTNPSHLDLEKITLDIEENYIFSRLNSAIKKITELFDGYGLNEVPLEAESLFLDLSRTYIQLTRDKASTGSDEEKKAVLFTVFKVLLESLKLFAPVAPFITEKIYQNIRNVFKLREESIHLFEWPNPSSEMIDNELESSMISIGEIVQAALALREKIHMGARWPLKEIVIATKDSNTISAINKMKEVIKKQLNVKEVNVIDSLPNTKLKVKADYAKIGPDFGDKAPKIIAQFTIDSPETVLKQIEGKGKYSCKINGETINLTKEHLIVAREIPLPYVEGKIKNGFVYLNKEITDELEAEGFAREIMRRVQALRKKAGLQKSNNISLFIKTGNELKDMLRDWSILIKDKVGASQLRISELEPSKKHEFVSAEKVKNMEFEIHFDMV